MTSCSVADNAVEILKCLANFFCYALVACRHQDSFVLKAAALVVQCGKRVLNDIQRQAAKAKALKTKATLKWWGLLRGKNHTDSYTAPTYNTQPTPSDRRRPASSIDHRLNAWCGVCCPAIGCHHFLSMHHS